MKRKTSFPLPFKTVRSITGGRVGSYVIGAMFTSDYTEKADRLIASCERLGLFYDVEEVPTVHRSISPRGTDDLAYTKANLIRHLLAKHNKPVLYLDSDCEIATPPTLIDDLVVSRCDFAIYNWYADEYTDRFIPIELSTKVNEPPIKNRFYQFAGSIDWFSTSQLGCSGLVQYYRNSLGASALLSRWHQNIAAFPGCADDAALAFTYNNLTRRSLLTWLLKVRWLPKSYARISYWIYTQPVIDHPDAYIPAQSSGQFTAIRDPKGRKVVYHSAMKRSVPRLLFPRDCIIDTKEHMICKLLNGELIPIEPTAANFWLQATVS